LRRDDAANGPADLDIDTLGPGVAEVVEIVECTTALGGRPDALLDDL
jgi:hypothetical protein